MRINAAGLDIIKSCESLRLTAYMCPAGKLTIGWGSTGPHVKPGMVIDQAHAEELLRIDVAYVEDNMTVLFGDDLTSNQFSAVVSLAYNIGVGAIAWSTLARKLLAGDIMSAAAEFPRWNKARVNGVLVPLAGLTKRRALEQRLFLTPDILDAA